MAELLVLSLPCRESEGTFELAFYEREADDLRAVIEHFSAANRIIAGIIGHSKGACFFIFWNLTVLWKGEVNCNILH